MRTGRPKKPLEIADEDRNKLTTIAHRPKSAQALAMRARIVLSCGQGMSNSEVAGKLHITGATVGKWRERFRKDGMDGLLDEPRVGAPTKNHGPANRRSSYQNIGIHAGQQHALEHPTDGRRNGPIAERYRADLACVWITAASGREVRLCAGI